MERSKRDLESIVNAQKEQLSRYETRLKDVVTAYKGLLKEKEALEASLTTFRNDKSSVDSVINKSNINTSNKSEEISSASSNSNIVNDDDGNNKPNNISTNTNDSSGLQMQIATVMNSLATLSAEKSRMEASFQADKKQLRQELNGKDKQIKELDEKLKTSMSHFKLEMEKLKTKLMVTRHDRDSDNNDHMIRIRELQKLLTDERHLKENIEMQLNNLKTQFAQTGGGKNDAQLKHSMEELEEMKRKYRELQQIKNDDQLQSSAAHIKQLQSELSQLKQQHSITIKNEQKRTFIAEERNKNLATIHEERVVNLETRLAELSTTIGAYDRYRQIDQENILKLKERILQLSNNNIDSVSITTTVNESKSIDNDQQQQHQQKHRTQEKSWNINELIDEITNLKKILILENSKLTTPIDLTKLFSSINNNDHHSVCVEEQHKLQCDYETSLKEIDNLTNTIDIQKNHIRTLQDKVKVLNSNIDEQEQELRNKFIAHANELKVERNKWKEILSSKEMDFRSKLAESEQQLQKQRERSLSLLDEKENEIKAIKTSYEIFIPGSSLHHQFIDSDRKEIADDDNDPIKMKSQKKMSSVHLNSVLNSSNSNIGGGGGGNGVGAIATCNTTHPITTESYHMLHYAQELARKDVDIVALRKAKYAAETSLRQALQDKVTSQEELHDKIINLEEQVDRLERCKSREGANLEYLKNVILSFLASTDKDSKRHMVNAIGAVLKFSPSEIKIINSYFINNKKDKK